MKKLEMEDVHCTVQKTIKREASKVLFVLGTNMTDAIRMFLAQVAIKKEIPFPINIPNKTTIKAIKEAKTKANSLKAYSSAKNLFNALDKDDK